MEDDASMVRHVLGHSNDYFRLLKVSRTSTEIEIKSAYKKLALKCHPDKNKHPQAEEAFKAIGKAHSVLSDPVKRRAYERGGEEGVLHHESGGTGHPAQRGGGQYYRQPQHPQDFFEEFLFGGRHHQQHQQQRQRQAHPQGAHQGEHVELNMNFVFLVPILIALLFISMIQSTVFDVTPTSRSRGSSASGSSSLPQFALTPGDGMTQIRTVSMHRDLNVKYYVSAATHAQIERGYINLRPLENEVLRQQRDSLGRRCESETMRQKARKAYGTPQVCEDFHRLNTRIPA